MPHSVGYRVRRVSADQFYGPLTLIGMAAAGRLVRELRTVLKWVDARCAITRQIAPVLTAFSAVALATAVLFAIESYLEAQHLVIAYLFPTTLVAIRYGSSVAFLTSFASGIAGAYFLFPPKFSLYVADPLHLAELGFFMLLALIASKIVSLLAEDIRASQSEPHPSQTLVGKPR
jgi:K+-sensing histidine kinase KdpD